MNERLETMKLYVGNLPYSAKQEDLESTFGAFGEVISAVIIKDKISGRSKGFAFVEMKDEASGKAAMEALNGKDMDGRAMNVSEARPKEENSGGGRPGGDRNFRR